MTISYQAGVLHMEGVALSEVADALGTPTYVYSKAYMKNAVATLTDAFSATPTKIHYSVKANSNISVLRLMGELGCGFDIVSSGELSRVLAAGCEPNQVIFSGVGKTTEEIDFALKLGIHCFNVESQQELDRISRRAENLQIVAPVSVRVNPNVDAQTHPYISTGLKENKFGVSPDIATQMYRQAREDAYLNPVGIDCHIGSQISQMEPLLEALTNLLALVDDLERENILLDHIDLGGGMGIQYQNETPLDVAAYGAAVGQLMAGRKQSIYLEPGRSLTANGGVLLTRTQYLKHTHMPETPSFAVVDAAMNDLIRPALYQAWHDVLPVTETGSGIATTWQIVGPICESGDFLAKERDLTLSQGDLLAVKSAGAYGMVLASNYNSRGRPCEVLVDGSDFSVIRRRETISDQLRLERDL